MTLMTEEELQKEYWYRVEERLGVLCGTDPPTPEQWKLAQDEAQETINQLRNENCLRRSN